MLALKITFNNRAIYRYYTSTISAFVECDFDIRSTFYSLCLIL